MKAVPDIVRVVLTQAARMRRSGAISDLVFSAQIERLEREELAPRGYHLLVYDTANGPTFSLKATATGVVLPLVGIGPLERSII